MSRSLHANAPKALRLSNGSIPKFGLHSGRRGWRGGWAGHNSTGNTPKLVGLFGIRYAKGVEVLGASHLPARQWLRHVSHTLICRARGVALGYSLA